MKQFDYSCGAPVLPPDHSLAGVAMVRSDLVCTIPEETTYNSASHLCQTNICAHCGEEGGDVLQEKKEMYRQFFQYANDA